MRNVNEDLSLRVMDLRRRFSCCNGDGEEGGGGGSGCGSSADSGCADECSSMLDACMAAADQVRATLYINVSRAGVGTYHKSFSTATLYG